MKKPLSLFFALLSLPIFAQFPGSLDPLFGNGVGYITKDNNSQTDNAKMVFLQQDGKIVIIGNSGDGFGPKTVLALRFLNNGEIDNSFATSGVFRESNFGLSAASIQYRELWSGALSPDGKTTLAGMYQTNTGSFIFLIRLLPDGTKDPGFGVNGIFNTEIINNGEPRGRPVKILLLPDDKVMVFTGNMTANKFTLLRVNSNGTLDDSFGTGGKLDVPSSLGNIFGIQALSMALQPDGKILAYGVASTPPNNSKGYLFRFLPDGTLDNTFSSDGEFITGGSFSGTGEVQSLLVLPDNKILIGQSVGLGMITKVNPNGTVDNTFGNNGTANPGFAFEGMALQSDGKIMCSGVRNSQAIVFRLLPDGDLDYSLGNNGGGYFALPQSSYYRFIVQQPDGKMVACGTKSSDFLIGRHLAETLSAENEPELATDFSVSPNPGQGNITLRFQLNEPQNLSISLFNATGQLVQTIAFDRPFDAGWQSYPVRLHDVLPGNYIVQIRGEKGQKSMVLQVSE